MGRNRRQKLNSDRRRRFRSKSPDSKPGRKRAARGRERVKKITRFRRHPLNRMNLGVLVFGGIFVYIIILIVLSSQTTSIAGYEVKLGRLAVRTSSRGVAVRNEKVYYADAAGYINFYARENERVSSGALVYSIDESGTLSEMMDEGRAVNAELGENDLAELKSEISNYRKNFTDRDFSSIYNFKYTLLGTVAKISNASLLAMLNSVSTNAAMGNSLDMGYADTSGILVYSVDGLEGISPAEVCKDTFNEESHAKKQHMENSLVEKGEPAYKLSTDENWSIVVPFDETWTDELKDGDYINVRFLKNGDTSWARMSFLHNEDGDYLQLSFTNSMLTFATDRYIDIELMTNEKKGLKIPNSSLVEREFYVIPKEYLTQGGDSDKNGFLRESYLEDGRLSAEFVEAKVYNETEEGVYIDISVLEPGDTLLMPNSGDKCTVSNRAKLTGVYNMNNGYADFTRVNVLYSNKEYSIVESGTNYGLSVYDHIVLDGGSVHDDDFVFEQRKKTE